MNTAVQLRTIAAFDLPRCDLVYGSPLRFLAGDRGPVALLAPGELVAYRLSGRRLTRLFVFRTLDIDDRLAAFVPGVRPRVRLLIAVRSAKRVRLARGLFLSLPDRLGAIGSVRLLLPAGRRRSRRTPRLGQNLAFAPDSDGTRSAWNEAKSARAREGSVTRFADPLADRGRSLDPIHRPTSVNRSPIHCSSTRRTRIVATASRQTPRDDEFFSDPSGPFRGRRGRAAPVQRRLRLRAHQARDALSQGGNAPSSLRGRFLVLVQQ